MFSDVDPMQEFIKLLQWKHSQGLIIWMLDDYDIMDWIHKTKTEHESIHPIWYFISHKLEKLKLNALHLDKQHWIERKKNFKSGCTTPQILAEFHLMDMKFKAVKEIISDSNPTSLHPIESYISNDHENNKPKYKVFKS